MGLQKISYRWAVAPSNITTVYLVEFRVGALYKFIVQMFFVVQSIKALKRKKDKQ